LSFVDVFDDARLRRLHALRQNGHCRKDEDNGPG
jgi:hypothetical protein